MIQLGPYHQASANTRYTGARIAKVLREIHLLNWEAKFHCIGHSLGSHSCGFAGKALKKIRPNLKFARISAMDPAGPLFLKNFLQAGSSLSPKEARLHKDDAIRVDAIHTSANLYGAFTQVGHIDFYPGNAGGYGYAQPPLNWLDDLKGGSHTRAVNL